MTATCSEMLQIAALNWLESSSTVRLILDERFHILWASIAARYALEDRTWIDEKDGAFCFVHSQNLGTLAQEAQKLCADGVFVQSYPAEDNNNVVAVLRLLPTHAPDERLYGLELRRRSDAEEVRYAGYRSWFGITNAEDRVLQQLLRGDNVEKCAISLDVSVDTVRSHVRQLYNKMNVSSREALFHAIMLFRVT